VDLADAIIFLSGYQTIAFGIMRAFLGLKRAGNGLRRLVRHIYVPAVIR
jgi:hypothetical protein